MPPGPRPPNPEEHEPFTAGRSAMDVATIDPVSEALPSAVTHSPTTRALALAAPVRVYVVAVDVCTVRVVGTAVVAEPPCGSELSTAKLEPLTAVTLPKAPIPPNPLPPAPGPRVRLEVGAPAARVASPRAPVGRAPEMRVPPGAEQFPFTAREISTAVAVIGPLVALGAAVGVAPPMPEVGWAPRTWTQTPTT